MEQFRCAAVGLERRRLLVPRERPAQGAGQAPARLGRQRPTSAPTSRPITNEEGLRQRLQPCPQRHDAPISCSVSCGGYALSGGGSVARRRTRSAKRATQPAFGDAAHQFVIEVRCLRTACVRMPAEKGQLQDEERLMFGDDECAALGAAPPWGSADWEEACGRARSLGRAFRVPVECARKRWHSAGLLDDALSGTGFGWRCRCWCPRGLSGPRRPWGAS